MNNPDQTHLEKQNMDLDDLHVFFGGGARVASPRRPGLIGCNPTSPPASASWKRIWRAAVCARRPPAEPVPLVRCCLITPSACWSWPTRRAAVADAEAARPPASRFDGKHRLPGCPPGWRRFISATRTCSWNCTLAPPRRCWRNCARGADCVLVRPGGRRWLAAPSRRLWKLLALIARRAIRRLPAPATCAPTLLTLPRLRLPPSAGAMAGQRRRAAGAGD